MGDTGLSSASGGSSAGAAIGNSFSDTPNLTDSDFSGLTDADIMGGGSSGGDLSSMFADAGLGSNILGDSSGLGGLFSTATDPTGTQAAAQSMTPAVDAVGTPPGSDPSANIGGTQSGGAPKPQQASGSGQQNQNQAQQNQSPLAALAKILKPAFGVGDKPTAGGPTGQTPAAPAQGGGIQALLSSILPTMPTPAETGELPPTAANIPPNQRNMPAPQNEQGETAPGSDQASPQAAPPAAPAAAAPPAAPAAPALPADTPLPPPRPASAAAPAAPAALPTKKGPVAAAPAAAPPGPPEGSGGPTDATGGIGGILRDVLGLALANPTLLPMLAQALMGGGGGRRGGGGIPPWAMHGMMPFMRGRGRGFGGFPGGFLRPGYYPRRQGGWGFHGGGYHPGWGTWAPGQGGNQPMAFAGGGGSSGGGGASGGWGGANTQSGGAIGPGADEAYRSSGLGSNPLINTLVGQESAGGQNIVSRTDADSRGLTLAQGGNPAEISQGYFQIQNHPGGTWQTYGRQAGIDLNKYPTPRSAPIDVQWKVAQRIPISAWGHDTQVAMQRRGFRYDPRMPLGQVAAQFGGTQVAGGGSPAPSSSTSPASGAPRANIRISDPDNPSGLTSHTYPAPTETGGAPPMQSDDFASAG